MLKHETILFAPLNWGLGHATRIVPLINQAIKQGNKVIIAADGTALSFLRIEFSDLQCIPLKGFKIRYWSRPFFNLGLFLQLPFFYASIWLEKHQTNKLVKKYNITEIISDNRYGVRNKNTRNIIVTHQLYIKVPLAFKLFEPLVHVITKKLIQKFDECWVPDYEEKERSLAGELAHGGKVWTNVKYIGPLSRFLNYKLITNREIEETPDVLVLISGPEPQRSKFEKDMEERFESSSKTVLVVCGKPEQKGNVAKGNIRKENHLSTAELFFYLMNCHTIIARSGYSTLMDLHVLGLKAELIPTPGQSEQEYLAEYMSSKNLFTHPFFEGLPSREDTLGYD